MRTVGTSILTAIMITLTIVATVWALGSAANYDHTAFATAVQGENADYAKGRWAALTHPLFLLRMEGSWTEFTLKASTNNFTSLVYYHLSWEAAGSAGDNAPKVFFMDSGRTDPRKLTIATNNVAIASQLTDTNSVVSAVALSPSRNTVVPAADWMSPDNVALQWRYARGTAAGLEKDNAGRIIWRPIEPAKWMSQQKTTP